MTGHRVTGGADVALSSEDITSGYIAGTLPQRRARALSGPPAPAAALAAALRPALERAPCVIGFSGGRDSSLLLAVAVAEARRAGLPPPIAVTLEFDSEATHERDWQELVLGHLGVEEWIRLPQGSELDMLGPVARRGLTRHGVCYPANAHMVVPLARVAHGGSVVTGFGGDDVLGAWPFQEIAAVLARGRPPHAGDLKAAVRWAMPARLRARRYARGRRWVRLPWLRAPHNEWAARRIAVDLAGSPRTWAGRMRWLPSLRLWPVSMHTMALFTGDERASAHAPLLEPAFLAALGAAGGRLGLGDRTALMRLLAADLLPASIIERSTKAEFSEPYYGPYTRRFAQEWDGVSGIDAQVVDADAVRAVWLSDHPHGLSALLLQSAWLATHLAAQHAAPVLSTGAGDGRD